MTQMAFVPASSALFLATPTSGAPIEEAALFEAVRPQGFPEKVRLLLPGTERASTTASGVVVDLLDVFPLWLAKRPDLGLDLSKTPLGKLLRLALSLVSSSRIYPRIFRQGVGSRYRARWRAALSASERASVGAIGAAWPLYMAETVSAGLPGSAGETVAPVARFLHSLIDRLVREACRRGAQVRLSGCAATSFEQRLVLALGDDKALLLSPAADDEAFARRCHQLGQWSQTALDFAMRPLLPSPPEWAAAESLEHVLSRFLRQAAQLASLLELGQPAPRMLPASAWKTEAPVKSITPAAAACRGPGPTQQVLRVAA